MILIQGSKIEYARQLLEQGFHVEAVVYRVSGAFAISESLARLTVGMAQG